MGILIGMDEAGYGPNLGPLVVAATAWEVEEGAELGDCESGGGRHIGRGGSSKRSRAAARPVTTGTLAESDLEREPGIATISPRQRQRQFQTSGEPPELWDVDLYRRLRPTVCRSAHENRIGIADSKVLYRPGLGLRQLERGLFAAFLAMEQTAICWSDVIARCGADPCAHHQSLAWHEGFDCPLPIDAAAAELARLGSRFAKACGKGGARPVAIRARLVFPAEFNDLVGRYGTKGAALSHVTVRLLREVVEEVRHGIAADGSGPIETAPNGANIGGGRSGGRTRADSGGAGPVFAVCDKHGGRNFYAALLQHHFSEHWIEPIFEGAGESRYAWGPSGARTCVSFRTRGESFLPTALASMTAKYLRELAMRAFNEFWCARVSGLKPTAGYPGDSRRFKQAIAARQRELGVDDHVLWRSR